MKQLIALSQAREQKIPRREAVAVSIARPQGGELRLTVRLCGFMVVVVVVGRSGGGGICGVGIGGGGGGGW